MSLGASRSIEDVMGPIYTFLLNRFAPLESGHYTDWELRKFRDAEEMIDLGE
jgi:hypothetical protein